jgi:hypothetical protein
MDMYTAGAVPPRARTAASAYRFTEAKARVLCIAVVTEADNITVALAGSAGFKSSNYNVRHALAGDRIAGADGGGGGGIEDAAFRDGEGEGTETAFV